MTGHQINSLVGDLVQMAQAMERLPQVEQQVTELSQELDARARANNDLRESNDILREHIDTLETKISEVTRERDDASFRVLETEDKLAAWERLAKAFSVDVSALVKAQTPEVVEPPKAEPVYTTSWFEGQPPKAIDDPLHSDPQMQVPPANDPWPRNERGQFAPGQGQSEPLPQSTAHDTMDHVTAHTAEATTTAHTTEQPTTAKPFAGKLYIFVPGFHTLSAWLDGGGSEAAYHWRQGQPLPEGIAA